MRKEELGELLNVHAASIARETRPAAFVKSGTAKPLISEPGNLPKLRELVRLAETTAIGPAAKKVIRKGVVRDAPT